MRLFRKQKIVYQSTQDLDMRLDKAGRKLRSYAPATKHLRLHA